MGRDKHHAPAPVVWHDYDPCFPAKRALPISADLLVSTHVLEHVEPELLHGTLMEFARIAQRVLYIAVPHRPSLAVLPDGRNAHLIQESPDWWHEILGEFFDSEPERLPVVYLKDGRQRDETRYVIKVNHGNIG
jgi:hypothetical protein